MQNQINCFIRSKHFVHHIERLKPSKFKFKTGQIIKLLSKNQNGLSRKELLLFFCQNFESASLLKRESLKMSVEKVIQRARLSFKENNLTIVFNKQTKKYVLQPLFE